MTKYYFTSESVTEGHPDKVCDLVADSILDEILKNDPAAHVACEVTATTDRLMVMGEVAANCRVDYEKIARDAVRVIGYTKDEYGFNCDTFKMENYIHEQSNDIKMGVDTEGAGDQGMMFGYACDETSVLMPLPITLAHALTQRMTEARKNAEIPYLRPDGKSQVTVCYEDGRPTAVTAVVVSSQHDDDVATETVRKDILNEVIMKTIPAKLISPDMKVFINPTGRFVTGGPHGDSGLTGRKIIVDTYGGYARHGGGALSGKDATKVDRSGTYMSRYIAKNLVSAGLCSKCEIQVSYAIGVKEPVSVMVDTFGTGKKTDEDIARLVSENFDLTPRGIIKTLDLARPIYKYTTNYGHLGKEGMSWEKTDMAEKLKNL